MDACCQAEALDLHDALVKHVVMTQINFAERDVRLCLDTSQAASDVRELSLLRCTMLQMDDLTGCWWMQGHMTRSENGIWLEAEFASASGEARRLAVQCREVRCE